MNILSDQDTQIQRLHYALDQLEERLVEFLHEVNRPDFYSLAAFEKMFRICRETLLDYRHRGWISFVRFRGKRYIQREELEALIEANYFPAFDPVVTQKDPISLQTPQRRKASPEELMAELDYLEKLFCALVCGDKKIP